MKIFLRLCLLFFIMGCALGVTIAKAQTLVVSNYSDTDHVVIYNSQKFPVKSFGVITVPVPKSGAGEVGLGTVAYGTSGGLPGIGPGEVWYLEITNTAGQYDGPVPGYTYKSATGATLASFESIPATFTVPVIGEIEMPAWVTTPEAAVFLMGFALFAGVRIFRAALKWFKRAGNDTNLSND